MFDNIIDGHEAQSDFYDEIQAEADSGLPQFCECGELAQDCECTTPDEFVSTALAQQTEQCPKLPGTPIIEGPANLNFADLCHWYQRGRELLGQSITIIVG